MITVVLLCWKRFEHFENTLEYWLRQDKVNEVIVIDNSGTFKTELPILLFNVNKNLGLPIRYLIAQIAKNDIIIFCDDDANHKDGVVEDFLEYYDENKILGIVGHKYTSKTLMGSEIISGRKIKTPTQVDSIAANTCMTHRKNCLVDIKKCYKPYSIDDIWWQEEAKKINKELSIWVIPTEKIFWYPEAFDEHALHGNPQVLADKEEFFQKFIRKHE